MGETIAVYENNTPAFYNIFAGEEIIGQFDGQDRRYYVKDHLGSIRMTINDSQGVDGYQDYYPFGKVMPGRSFTSGNLYDNYKFTGHERDDEFDLTLDYMQARMYDPVIGRFLSVDPALEYSSPYTYVGNNPLRRTDPTGMYSREVTYEEMLLRGSQTALEFKHGQNLFNENQTSTNDPDENSSSCVGLMCGSSANYDIQTKPTIRDRIAGLRQEAKNNPWAAAGKFYSAGYSISGGEMIATMDGRGFATSIDELRADQTFGEIISFGIGSGMYSAMGGIRQWVRFGPSYSHNLGQPIRLSLRWGASPHYANKYIKSPIFRRWNQSLRARRLPFGGWRSEPGHFHILK